MTGGPRPAAEEPLLVQLREAARQDATQRLDEARGEAEAILAGARARAGRRLSEALDDRRAELARNHDQLLAAARADAGRVTLAARERLVERVLAVARDRASRLRDGDAAGDWLRAALRDALAYLPEGPVVVSTDLPHAQAAAAEVAPERTVTVEPLDEPGMCARSADGAVIVDATFARHLRAERPRLAIAIVTRVAEDA